MDIETGRTKWVELHKQWEIKNQEARRAQATVTAKFHAVANGSGINPTEEEVNRSMLLDREAYQLRMQMDDVIRQVFGV